MRKFDINNANLKEIDFKEMQETNGGAFFIALAGLLYYGVVATAVTAVTCAVGYGFMRAVAYLIEGK